MTERISDLETALEMLASARPEFWKLSHWGVTRFRRPAPALVDRDAYTPTPNRIRVLLVAGLSGHPDDVSQARRALELFVSQARRVQDAIALSAIPCGNPTAFLLY